MISFVKISQMKKILLSLSGLLLLVSCNQQKIAYVDNSVLINDYLEKQDLENRYNSELEKSKKKADSLSRILKIKFDMLQEEAKNLSKEDAQAAYDAFVVTQRDTRTGIQMEAQQIAENSQNDIDSLLVKVKGFVNSYGKEHGYTYILGSNEAGSVLYGDEKLDITQEVLTALNENYKDSK